MFAVLASGLAFESTRILLAPSPDYRYSRWMAVCSSIAVVILTKRRARAQSKAAT